MTVIKINRKTGTETTVETGLSAEKAERLALRCTFAEPNPAVVYEVR
jgi:hypothetical protein